MISVRNIATLLLSLSSLAGAQGYRPDFDPSTFKGPASGAPNEVLVLGSPHLSQLPPSFEVANLRLLNDRLADWRPQAIAIEAISGEQCDFMRRYPQRYKASTDSYCWNPAPAKAAILNFSVSPFVRTHGLSGKVTPSGWPSS